MKVIWHKTGYKSHEGTLCISDDRLIFFNGAAHIEHVMERVRLVSMDSDGMRFNGYVPKGFDKDNKKKYAFEEHFFTYQYNAL